MEWYIPRRPVIPSANGKYAALLKLFPNDETENSVVLLNLRGYDNLGSTFLGVLDKYTDDLRAHQSKLMLFGVSPSVTSQLEKTGLIRKMAWENSYPATDQIGQSGMEAWKQAEKWVAENKSVKHSAASQRKTIFMGTRWSRIDT